MLTLTGEIRGITVSKFDDKPDKHYIVVEDGNLRTWKVGLAAQDVANGVSDQAKKLRGQICNIKMECGVYNGNQYFKYAGHIKPSEKNAA